MVEPEEFLDFADRLRSSKKEIDFRNIMSRSYYAAFLLAKDKSTKINTGVDVTNAGSHEKTIFQFSQSTVEDLKQIGNHLNRLKRGRIKSDYHLDKIITKIESETHFSMAEIAIGELNKI
ncbi:MAG: hypothetical protein PHQ03_01275 [Methylococcales bacterium]|nr:hypothetical protein [Methylococcales bacterium]